jgi:hypothetical protein
MMPDGGGKAPKSKVANGAPALSRDHRLEASSQALIAALRVSPQR